MPEKGAGGPAPFALGCDTRPRTRHYGHTMPDDLPHDPRLLWSVEVEVPRRRSWSPRRRRRLRREIETDARIVRVLKPSALWYPAVRLLVPLYPHVKVAVASVGVTGRRTDSRREPSRVR
jgi:hypothetical protein